MRAIDQIVFSQWIKSEFCSGAVQIRIDLQRLQIADLNTFVHHRRTTGLQTFEVTEFDLHADPGSGGVEVFIKTERQARIGRRAVLAILWRGEGNTAGDNTRQRFAAHFYPRQVGVDADAAGVPETCVFTHQFGVGRLDKDLELDGTLVFRKQIAFDLADLDLLVEHRAAAAQRAETICLDGQVQTRLGIRQRRLFSQRLELAQRLAFAGTDGDVITGDQCFQPGDTGQRDAWFDQPETGAGLEVWLDVFIHLDRGDHSFGVPFIVELERLDLTDRHTFVHDLGLVGLDAFAALEANLDLDTGFGVSTPAEPATDDQRNQRQYPNGRPVRGRSGFRYRQISHGRHPTPCYPKSVGDRKLLQQASSESPQWRRRWRQDWLRHWQAGRS